MAVGTRPGTIQFTLGGVNRNLVIAKYIGDTFRGQKESLSAFVNRVAEVLGVARITRKRKSTFASSTKEKRTRTESGKEMIDRHKIKDKHQGIHTVNIPNVKTGSYLTREIDNSHVNELIQTLQLQVTIPPVLLEEESGEEEESLTDLLQTKDLKSL